jgi:hypothetical protein
MPRSRVVPRRSPSAWRTPRSTRARCSRSPAGQGARVGKGRGRWFAELGRYGATPGWPGRLPKTFANRRECGGNGRRRGVALLAAMAESGRPLLPIGLAAARDPKVGEGWKRLSRRTDADLAREIVERSSRTWRLHGRPGALAQESWNARRALETVPESPYRTSLDRLCRTTVGATGAFRKRELNRLANSA